MNKNWKYKKISEVMSVERGGSPRPIQKYLTDSKDGINWIKISDATASDKYIYKTKQKITKEGLHKTRLVKEGDFLLSNSMSFGRPYIMKTTGCIHDGWLVLKEKEHNILDKDFLYHLLGSPYIFEQFDKLAAGSTVRNLNIKLVSSVEIPILPIQEQKQIVAILDKAFTAIDQAKANIEKNIVNAKELFQSKREGFFIKAYEISGNKSDILQNLCTIKTGKLNANAMVENGKYPFFTCSRQIFSIDNYAFDTEAVLLAGNNASGDFNVKYYKGKFNAYQRTYVLTIDNEDLSYSFLKHKLEHNLQAFKRQSVGANTRFLKIGMINNLEIPIPTIKIQKELCNNLDLLNDNLDILISSYVKKLNSLEDLKKSILQKAFSGELTQKEVLV